MNQHETPLFTGLKKHRDQTPIQFHIPGHKGGKGMDEEFREFMGENALSIDLINIEPLDDLHHPQGMIKEAQDLAAEAFGADYTFFSVQGTSGAIMTMIMSVCQPGDKIIVPRNVHKSITTAIIFSGAKPVFIHPELDERFGISHGITSHAVKKACEAHPDAKGVLVINPTYFGVTADLQEIVEIAHNYDIPVLVDEAHGVHIHFHERLPLSAMQAGADLAATSVHKLGGSLTQSSVLNLREGLVSHERVQSILSMLTTTSTSYILLASLDTARRHLAINGHALMEETLRLADLARQQLNEIPSIYCPGNEILTSDATVDYDPTKLIISVKKLGMSGYDVEVWLRENYHIEVELSDLYNILCIVTPGDRGSDIEKLVVALKCLADQCVSVDDVASIPVKVPAIPVLSLSPRDAFYASTETILLKEAVGRISAEFVMVYPPGIPIFIPGEIITSDNIDYIHENIEAGLPVQGPEDDTLEKIQVIREQKAFK
ncbi:aminotransferase class I/II-fold pyridoxal phosphate-dependent enzyme [Halobacillus litoralis]|uniref:Arginine decarboxylase n=1 Tax=Halobacillus litoralis TaxID=45668 RepID=A0A410M8W8_9BACI|nr:aminotransferase class I/II-fold pyridoxal phosphate-dependent enzyme [Halobacillus litoralis]QAS51149.1 arginine decarboxylase [Halobacillus litoralis]